MDADAAGLFYDAASETASTGANHSADFSLGSKAMGGDGHLTFTEPLERITDKEDKFNVGIDEQDKIVGVSEEFLKDRIARFAGYKQVLQKREDEYQDKLEVCDTDLAAREHDMKKKKEEAKATPAADSDAAASSNE